ncbi:MAG: hypothetical protein GYA36_19640 [Veillonellaceae bacterium]|nr:hypothetical protein [Veillonellaceae bacterium]
MLVEWIMAVIMAFTSAWSPRECEPEDQACVAANTTRAEGLREIAQAIVDESARQDIDPLMVTAVIARESSFIREPCTKRMPLSRVISYEPDGRGRGDSYTLKWKCPNSVWGPECKVRVWDVREEGEHLYYSTCSADEVGLMQIVPWAPWARAGAVIPGTEQAVPGAVLNGEEGGRTVDLTGPLDGSWMVPAIEGTPVLQLTLPDDNDRDDRPETWSSIILSMETIDTGVRLTLQTRLPQDLESFTDFMFARGLPISPHERRELMLDFSINIAIGCGEIGMDKAEFSRAGHPEWWDWIGTYNTGSRGTTANRYASNIRSTYLRMCETIIATDEQGNVTRLKDNWAGCAEAEEN